MVDRLGRGISGRGPTNMLTIAGGILLAVFALAILRHLGRVVIILLLLVILIGLASHP